MKNRNVPGFTLIELLIVVAIIAILAAIAVPNFLEAQVRAKTSRAKADLRTMATAIESYAIDNNVPPIGAWEHSTQMGITSVGWDINTDPIINIKCQSVLTTPISYMASLLVDPFKEKQKINPNNGQALANPDVYYGYESYYNSKNTNNNQKKCFQNGYSWVAWSLGPRRISGGLIAQILISWPKSKDLGPDCAYDPTNGTVSEGVIIRTSKGVFTVPFS